MHVSVPKDLLVPVDRNKTLYGTYLSNGLLSLFEMVYTPTAFP